MEDYKLSTFVLDLFLGAITGGIWWIYRIIKILVGLGHKD